MVLKNRLSSLLLLLLIVSSSFYSKATGSFTLIKDTITINTTLVHCTDAVDLSPAIQNNSSTDTLPMRWKVASQFLPSAWGIQICDPHTCYGSLALTGIKSYQLRPTLTGNYKLSVNAANTTGSGTVALLIWDSRDSVHTAQYLTFIDTISVAGCTTIGINSVDFSNINVFPNPVKDQVKLSGLDEIRNGKVELYDVLGNVVSKKEVNNVSSIELTTNDLLSGIYIVKVFNQNEAVYTKRVNKL